MFDETNLEQVRERNRQAKEAKANKDRRYRENKKRKNKDKILETENKGPRIATLDFETDPFKVDRVPQAFAAGLLYDDGEYKEWWGEEAEDVVVAVAAYLITLEEKTIVYAHNGGRFDFHYVLCGLELLMNSVEKARNFFNNYHGEDTIKPFLIGSRIVKCQLGQHVELRDSYAILPVALSAYKKTEIDYEKFEKEVRNQHKKEILAYLKSDCQYLMDLVLAFRQEFGDNLTIGMASIKTLTEYHPWDRLRQQDDKFIRGYYFGGHVECFKTGYLKGPWKVYDINSQYPWAMANCMHPIGSRYKITKEITENTDFAYITANCKGYLPWRDGKGSINFPNESKRYEQFYVTGHELRYAMKQRGFKIAEVLCAIEFYERGTFKDFVDMYYSKRSIAKKAEKELGMPPSKSLFYKLILNAAYGKFGQNPDNWNETVITFEGQKMPEEWHELGYKITEYGRLVDVGLGPVLYSIYQRPATRRSYNNVATAASITGAARTRLLEGLGNAVNPIYCDTDSIFCKDLKDNISETELGAFKFEGVYDHALIHSPKLYMLLSDTPGVEPKFATKGVKFTPLQIVNLFRGLDAKFSSMAPSLRLGSDAMFIKRQVKARQEGFSEYDDMIALLDREGLL